jgi:hypothetical protein
MDGSHVILVTISYKSVRILVRTSSTDKPLFGMNL